MIRNIGKLVFMALLGMTTFSLNAEDRVCHHCEEIREYNAEHHHNFEYYEEYLKGGEVETADKAKGLKK